MNPAVAVWMNGLGSSNILLGIHRAAGPLSNIHDSPACVLPQVTDCAFLTEHNMHCLRDWVAGGGRLLLTRDAVGFAWHPRWFREVGVGVSRPTRRTIEFVVDDAPVKTLIHMSSDHVIIQPGSGATVLARDPVNGAPVIVEGTFGKGKVILCGFAIGSPDDQFMSADEAAVLKWLVSRLLK